VVGTLLALTQSLSVGMLSAGGQWGLQALSGLVANSSDSNSPATVCPGQGWGPRCLFKVL